MLVNVKKIYQNVIKVNTLSIDKNIVKWEKTFYYNYKKVF